MATSKNHQEAHGIGQAEEQLARQAKASETLQGANETDQEIEAATHQEVGEYFEEDED